jgi:hypothetical protein
MVAGKLHARLQCAAALAASLMCTPAGAQGGKGVPPADLAFWRKVWVERTAIASFGDFPVAAGRGAALAINQADATRAINTIISRKTGIFTDDELKNILADFHVDELSAQYKVATAGSPLQQGLSITIAHIIHASPNREASAQLVKALQPYFPGPTFQNDARMAYESCNLINDTLGYGFRCPATTQFVDYDSKEPLEAALAKMSAATYKIGVVGKTVDPVIDGFSLVGTPIVKDYGFAGLVYAKDDMIVMAIRGTQLNIAGQAIRNLSADYAFLSWTNGVMLGELSGAVELLARIHEVYPNAHVYLTGHSLGGTVAQLLAAETSLPTATFDAPGAGTFATDALLALAPLDHVRFASSGKIVNYVTMGDYISSWGVPYGSVCTVGQPKTVNWDDVLGNHDHDLSARVMADPTLPRYPVRIDRNTKIPSPGTCPTM